MTFTAKALVDFVLSVRGHGYVWGGLGYQLTASRLNQPIKQYPAHYTATYQIKAKRLLNTRVFDCIGLIKFFLWGNTLEGTTLKYGTNGIPDTTADGFLKLCKDRGLRWGSISNIPEIPGLMVHSSGHVGVYIGNGKVVEARGIDYGVVQTSLKDRGWVSWAMLPLVNYEPIKETQPKKESEEEEVRYQTLKDVPNNWGGGEPRATIQKLMDAGILNGDGAGNIDLSHDMVRMLILNYRGGCYDRQLVEKGFKPSVSN